MSATNQNWEFKSEHDILVACVGYNFGPNPTSVLTEIRVSRGAYGHTVANRLQLNANDVVVDIGSGCGFVGRTIAPQVKNLHCVDLSPDFLAYCKKELSEFPNVETHLIKYADYSALAGKGVNKVYSTAVWIHFNYYDLHHNLKALQSIMAPGGQLYFDYADAEGIKDGDGRIFNEHANGYFYNREAIFNLVQYNGFSAVRVALESNGFRVDERWQVDAESFAILATRI
jgi:cyclopropane fatty-acyl-phospholipid synthase-like methyltransferase